ncbi:hypothetical protein AB9Q10_16495 [Streptomyces krungchingensis]|uniref:hypothetical protein n=1 Tax=Streptomyces krungchingensis TaxID=1565034 RepID=UPI003CF26C7E
MTGKPSPPPVERLTYAQYSGWACCWCTKKLWHGAVSAGISRGSSGAHVLDIEVYAHPECIPAPATTSGGSE